MRRGHVCVLATAAALLAAPVLATDYSLSWACFVTGDPALLASGHSESLFGSVTFGGDTVHDNDMNFVLPNNSIGQATGLSAGTVTLDCTVSAAGPYWIHDLTVDLLGVLKPGTKALNPHISWVVQVFNGSGGLMVNDAGTDFSQPATRHYDFALSDKVRILQKYTLDGVSVGGVIDPEAVASLPLVEAQVSVARVPEPAGWCGALAALRILLGRKRRRA